MSDAHQRLADDLNTIARVFEASSAIIGVSGKDVCVFSDLPRLSRSLRDAVAAVTEGEAMG